MNKLQELLSAKTRLEMRIEDLRAAGHSRTDEIIDLATIENEIADLEWEMNQPYSHDHVLRCPRCGTEKIWKDCQCKVAGGETVRRCGPCDIDTDYAETERQRCVNY